MKITESAQGIGRIDFGPEDIPQGREKDGSCGLATPRATAQILLRHRISEAKIARKIGREQGEAVGGGRFRKALKAVDLYPSKWFQGTLALSARLLDVEGIALIVNYMDGSDADPDNNHYAILAGVTASYVLLQDTQVRGKCDFMRAFDFLQLWHYVDPDVKRQSKLTNWMIIAALSKAHLRAAKVVRDTPIASPFLPPLNAL
jgi:hypothetical protein